MADLRLRAHGASQRPRVRIRGLLTLLVLGAGLSACGGSSPRTSSTKSTSGTTTSTSTTTSTGTSTTPSGPMRVTLTAVNHTPVVNRPWKYTVTVTDAQGRGLSGTETTHYAFGGAVVGTEKPTNVKFSHGVYRDTIEFPPTAVGYPLVLQAVVHTSLGTATRTWAVKVQKH